MRKIFIAFAALLICVAGMGQNVIADVPQKCIAFNPDVLRADLIRLSDIEKLMKSSDFGQNSSSKSDKEHWIAFSDRSDNYVYSAPQHGEKIGTLAFNEEVRIAKIKNGYALVYYEPKGGELWPRISKDAVWKGWIPMSHLLLWRRCPVNEKSIYNKAMICANIDQDIKNGNFGKLLKNPEDNTSSEKLSINFVYYFQMKREGSMVLLARENTLDGDSRKVLYGWVDENSFVDWNQRTCLEPTWKIEDVEYFAGHKITVPIYSDANMKTKASSIGYETKSSSSYDPYLYRMNADVLRYPILDNNTSTLWNCSTFSSSGTSAAINKGTTAEGSNNSPLQKVIDDLKKVKIAIVIDGTRSMEPYYVPVKDAVKQVTEFFHKSQNVKVQVGVVIYRDYADGDYATEIFPLTDPKNEKLAQWLDSGGKGGIRSSSNDRTLEEAMFLGIDTAIDAFRFNPNESNFMFVIGDCGNAANDNRISRETIIDKMVKKNINLVGFQVRNYSNSPAYGAFNSQLQYIMKESLRQRYALFPSMKGKNITIKREHDGYYFTPDNTTGTTFFYASHKYIQSGDMPAAKLENLMTTAFSYVTSTVGAATDVVIDTRTIVDEYFKNVENNGTTTTIEYDFLVQRLGKEYIESLKKQNATITFKGYTPREDNSGREYYQTVIFISQEEFNTLIIRLGELYNVAMAKSNDRAPYIKAMKALIQSMIPGISDADMQKMDINEVMNLISGVNVQTTSMKKRTLAEIASTAAVKQSEYISILNEFKIKYQGLQNIKNRPYKFVRKFNGASYYWIPTEDLP